MTKEIGILKTMLENGGDPDVSNDGGHTPKDFCCISCQNNSCAEKCKAIQGNLVIILEK